MILFLAKMFYLSLRKVVMTSYFCVVREKGVKMVKLDQRKMIPPHLEFFRINNICMQTVVLFVGGSLTIPF